MKRRIFVSIVFVLAIALCGGLIWFNFFRDRMIADFFAKMQQPAQTVAAATVESRVWKPGIPAIGTARAGNGVQLAVETAGVVKEIHLQPNKRFARGEVLVQLDDAVERADLADAKSSLQLNQAALERSEALRAKGFATEASYEQTVAQLATARSRMARLEAVIQQKALKAPFAGVAGIARIDVGQFVTAGTVVATFQDMRTMKVDFSVPEQFLSKMSIGQVVRFGVSETELRFEGKISGIDPRIDPQTRLVLVQALITDNPDDGITPGQFLFVRVELPEEPAIVTVPQTAVITSLYGDYVYLVDKDEKDGNAREIVRQVFVKVGRREGAFSEILSGVEPGQTVVASGQNKVQPGAVVNIDRSIDVTNLNRR
ncbi:MAG TPA: efflux RND transporter periplasmic adaptor subunit [Xanthobacteraceae bacterium]|nr:efflux RND transporter periplasmic adaptor subunit [Xanthobacteraceae bacterium]